MPNPLKIGKINVISNGFLFHGIQKRKKKAV
jgi:hypothetical protein